ncbi:hypothetical protein [Frigoriglobus tundricola]|uniref:Carboxypeptidase regulatory-like domain-containing protein n=1 Tax=Frigoriglobus tundricola TaxID=2774151 RepID=A0A6M5YW47_9BACT|nr:hypothetical protein [Frigoriglobus tundricola]QJW97694.1 hypothetical protein FTUN_5271 [Frigoriglobus tundricola]
MPIRALVPCFVFAAIVGALLVGCNNPTPETAKASPTDKARPTFGIPVAMLGSSSLTGKVTLNGEPVIAGRVLLFTADGMVMSVGVIDEKGNYSIEKVPDGPADAVVVLDPSGEMPFPVLGSSSSGAPKGGGPVGVPKGGPPGVPKGPPPKGPPGAPSVEFTGPKPLPAHFLQEMKFTVPAKEQAKYKAAHLKYGKTSPNNPLKVTITGATTYHLVLTG